MSGIEDFVDLARELASIASTATDPAAARQLIEIVERLLGEAGLPQENGGGDAPTRWFCEPICEAA